MTYVSGKIACYFLKLIVMESDIGVNLGRMIGCNMHYSKVAEFAEILMLLPYDFD